MLRTSKRGLLTLAFLVAFCAAGTATAEERLPGKSAKSCLKCHSYDKESNIFAGKLGDVSRKAKTIQLKIDGDSEVVHFDSETKLENAPSMKQIPKSESVKIVYYKKNGKNYARKVVVKKGLEVPEKQLASVGEVEQLVAKGDTADYVLIDSRPPRRYNEGHIPTALSMPFFAFDKLKGQVLPDDKSVLQIYYCGGFT
jgi:hypothetical protein